MKKVAVLDVIMIQHDMTKNHPLIEDERMMKDLRDPHIKELEAHHQEKVFF